MPRRWEQRVDAQVLEPSRAGERIALGRADSPPGLAPFVDYFWWVAWDTPEPYGQAVIPRPVLHLSAERTGGRARLLVNGVHRRRFTRTLSGRGRTIATAFRPGGFHPFLRRDVAELLDREVGAADLLGVDDREVADALVGDDLDVEDGVALLAGWLTSLEPAADPVVDDVTRLVELAEQDTSVVRAQQLADAAGVSLRTLQRQFRAYVGAGPKWVVQLFRLLDVAEAAHLEGSADWAALASELGYADQSHLIRNFTAMVGRPPAAYAAEA